MNIHVFIVDSKTLKSHLEYMFAGTGDTDKKLPFLQDAKAYCHHSTERNLVGMIADISRIRPKDKVIFYLQASEGKQGRFFGVFEVESFSFFDENDEKNYLANQLGKGLALRVRIKPDNVYQYGVTEREALDELTGIEKPYQLCWSMIYRKLKGNRGCTMITEYEFNALNMKLHVKNKGKILKNKGFTFDDNEKRIINTDINKNYIGRQNSLDIQPRLIYKAKKNNSFETHLQALIMQKFDSAPLKDKLLTLKNGSAWIGNEVSCGVGMQRIDIMIIENDASEFHLRIIELKDEKPVNNIIDEQLPWYLKWTMQYVVPNLLYDGKKVIIHPCIIAKRTNDESIINKIKTKQMINVNICDVRVDNTEYIAFEINNESIEFNKIL